MKNIFIGLVFLLFISCEKEANFENRLTENNGKWYMEMYQIFNGNSMGDGNLEIEYENLGDMVFNEDGTGEIVYKTISPDFKWEIITEDGTNDLKITIKADQSLINRIHPFIYYFINNFGIPDDDYHPSYYYLTFSILSEDEKILYLKTSNLYNPYNIWFNYSYDEYWAEILLTR